MKKLLLFSSVFSFTLLNAQVVVEDNFDAYTAGTGLVAQSSNWNTWDGSAGVDPLVSSDYAVSGSNSVKINGTNNDLVLPLGPFTSGSYEAFWKMYIPAGEGAYFNGLHNWSASSTSYQWAVDVFFAPTGAISTTAAGTNVIASQVFTADTWFDVKLEINLDTDNARVIINGETIREWQWSLINNTGVAGNNQLSGINFYGTEGPSGANTGGLYYIDDVTVNQVESTANVTSLVAETITPSIYPNPASNQVTIESPSTYESGTVTIFDLTGKVVYQHNVSATTLIQTISVNNLSQGIYIIQWKNGSLVSTQRFMKR